MTETLVTVQILDKLDACCERDGCHRCTTIVRLSNGIGWRSLLNVNGDIITVNGAAHNEEYRVTQS
jgi:hypothetical protein